ncbi:hypothetical protein A3A93_06045 [Candidatus Roizmanbacteria bacterium RIFCSPLOWO2_01_FULL_38_12]|uniref:Uncharacterized protein n=1 Tax=Candidatus Roizmanbacteria bacterium RIFCSPLOWO2_01_FULL_38_12 TaxID=1802061 RepID=A0A1F7IVC4_9BACT|nr:MAG: hypothetical protein A2861_03045 [Candidatus Roizmanbacteria bacterium RIFCSPHIGHO2_01_FULL_38_15]OGK36280.1 MAG: hypothetical protein A3F59_00185 [Candidatus Roizmanbacteria bacterium RIFCSPHIGHO2_12_FULL_38_13]OGK47319.1 MAG: hypothetical protein A3A93_06045 [Candidatus Roizmanbacteria bacterium RIFCSPLOWO2_01_FULL_38_12]
MKNKRGEVSTVVILGTFLVIILAVFLNNATRQRNTTDTRASAGSCRDNPVPPTDGYIWVADCTKTCKDNTECAQNTFDPNNVNPETSNWCYQFVEADGLVNHCLKLRKTGVAAPTSTSTPTAPTPTLISTSIPTATPKPTSTVPPTPTFTKIPTPTTRSTSDLTRDNVTPIPTSAPTSTPTQVSISDKTRENVTPTPVSISDKTRGNVDSIKTITIDNTIQGKACLGDPSTDYGCIDIYGFYSN